MCIWTWVSVTMCACMHACSCPSLSRSLSRSLTLSLYLPLLSLSFLLFLFPSPLFLSASLSRLYHYFACVCINILDNIHLHNLNNNVCRPCESLLKDKIVNVYVRITKIKLKRKTMLLLRYSSWDHGIFLRWFFSNWSQSKAYIEIISENCL